jgi:RNA polymerase sigma-70 factor (ECF subfamily)
MGADARELETSTRRTEVNGQPGAMFVDRSGRLINVMTLDIVDGVVQTVRSIINRDKLRHLGPLSDLEQLLRERGRQHAEER